MEIETGKWTKAIDGRQSGKREDGENAGGWKMKLENGRRLQTDEKTKAVDG